MGPSPGGTSTRAWPAATGTFHPDCGWKISIQRSFPPPTGRSNSPGMSPSPIEAPVPNKRPNDEQVPDAFDRCPVGPRDVQSSPGERRG